MSGTAVIEQATIAGSVAAHDLSVWGLIMQADLIVKGVMLLLIVASFACWAIIFEKWSYYRRVRNNTMRFEKAFRASKVLKSLYDRVNKKSRSNAMLAMFIAGMQEYNASPLKDGKKVTGDALSLLRERLLSALFVAKHESLAKMESKLIILATVGSASPFIGLFGTVWGIVNSFQAIAATKNTTLAVVAPGIAEALLATAMGLFAAIPAVIFYNLFSNEIRLASGKLDDFANELSVKLISQGG